MKEISNTHEKDLVNSITSAFQTYEDAEKKEQEKQQGYKIVSSPCIDRTKLMTRKEVAKICPISESKIRKLCKDSKRNNFPCIYFGNKVYIFVDEIYNWLLEHAGERF